MPEEIALLYCITKSITEDTKVEHTRTWTVSAMRRHLPGGDSYTAGTGGRFVREGKTEDKERVNSPCLL